MKLGKRPSAESISSRTPGSQHAPSPISTPVVHSLAFVQPSLTISTRNVFGLAKKAKICFEPARRKLPGLGACKARSRLTSSRRSPHGDPSLLFTAVPAAGRGPFACRAANAKTAKDREMTRAKFPLQNPPGSPTLGLSEDSRILSFFCVPSNHSSNVQGRFSEQTAERRAEELQTAEQPSDGRPSGNRSGGGRPSGPTCATNFSSRP